ncbi:hypothetical protein BJY04DRAFT_221955 [Aspergillus karnatakaensis]|uniref:uncharacterized protein n=1 Tax=Aspergillus karnatakaensis TaxID=1810916 RepID=UPI003CCD28CB
MSGLTPEQIAYFQAHADDDLRPNRIAACTCAFVVVIAAITARVIARFRSKGGFGLDDYIIFGAVAFQLSYDILAVINIVNGGGLHIIFVKNMQLFGEGYVAASICYAITIMLTKVSILAFYYRIFPLRWLLHTSYAVGAVVVAYNFAIVLVVSFECIPLSSLWTGKPGTCIDTSTPFTILAVVNILTDVAILALPVKPVLGLQMKPKRKLQVLSIFLLGGTVCAFSTVRAVVMSKTEPGDPSYNGTPSAIWSLVECSVGIAAACLPTLSPLFKKREKNTSGTDGSEKALYPGLSPSLSERSDSLSGRLKPGSDVSVCSRDV